MSTFIVFITITILLYYFQFIGFTSLIVPILLVYFLPKFLIRLSNKFLFPSILIENKSQFNLEKKNIAITFDDIPYSDGSSFKLILEQLRKYKIKASFFIISGQVNEKNKPDLIQAVKDGHLLCNHGKSNSFHALISYERLINEIESCEGEISSIYEEANISRPNVKFYRPGCGFFHSKMIKFLNENQIKLTLGIVYPHDPGFRFSYLNYLYLSFKIESGDIIILHDRAWTPKTLELILPYLQSNDFNCITLDEFVKK